MSVYNPSTLERPDSIEELISILKDSQGSARIVAGNTTIYELARQGAMVDVDKLIDISGLGLAYVREIEDADNQRSLRLGATTTFSEIASNQLLSKPPYYSLRETASKITPPQVRNMGTIGGAVCSGIPFYDMPTTALALGAKMSIVSDTGSRLVDVSDFFVDYFVTSLSQSDFLTEIQFKYEPNSVTSFEKLGRMSADFAVVNVSTRIVFEKTTRFVENARIALGAVSNTPVLAIEAAEYLKGKEFSPETILKAASLAAEAVSEPMPSVHASSHYKKKVIPVVVRDALLSARDRVRSGGS